MRLDTPKARDFTEANVSRPIRSIQTLLEPLNQIAAESPNLIANGAGRFESAGHGYELPRYVFVGPKGGLQEKALVVALQTILTEYRKFIAYAPNL